MRSGLRWSARLLGRRRASVWVDPGLPELRAAVQDLTRSSLQSIYNADEESDGIQLAGPLSVACVSAAYAGDPEMYSACRDWLLRGVGFGYNSGRRLIEAFEAAEGPFPERMWLLGRIMSAADEMYEVELAGSAAMVLTDAVLTCAQDPVLSTRPASAWAAGYLVGHYGKYYWMSENQADKTKSGVNKLKSSFARSVKVAEDLLDTLSRPFGMETPCMVPRAALAGIEVEALKPELQQVGVLAGGKLPPQLQPGDVIRAVDGIKLHSELDFHKVAREGDEGEVLCMLSRTAALPDLRWAEVMLLHGACLAGNDEDFQRHAYRLRNGSLISALTDIPEGDFRGWAAALCCQAAAKVGRTKLAVSLAQYTMAFLREGKGNPQDKVIAPLVLRAALVDLHPHEPKIAKKAAKDTLPKVPFVVAGELPRPLAPPRVSAAFIESMSARQYAGNVL
eukprot:Hpha_TRINITY_DN27649_c0_g1::TRINITY_DN27649_c0_g1_i1::g.57362::m.57362